MRDREVRPRPRSRRAGSREAHVEAREQRSLAALGELLGHVDRQQRLAGSGRPRHRGPLAVQHVREDPRLFVRELDDLPVLLVELELQRRADLDPVPQREGQRVHALGAERATRALPERHDLADPVGEAMHVAPVDHDLRRRAGMRGRVVRAVRERDAVAERGLPPLLARLRARGSAPASASRPSPVRTDPSRACARRCDRTASSAAWPGRSGASPPLASSTRTPSSGCAITKSASPCSGCSRPAPGRGAITQSTEWYTTYSSESCSRNPSYRRRSAEDSVGSIGNGTIRAMSGDASARVETAAPPCEDAAPVARTV